MNAAITVFQFGARITRRFYGTRSPTAQKQKSPAEAQGDEGAAPKGSAPWPEPERRRAEMKKPGGFSLGLFDLDAVIESVAEMYRSATLAVKH